MSIILMDNFMETNDLELVDEILLRFPMKISSFNIIKMEMEFSCSQ
jgi:hypothetical protein